MTTTSPTASRRASAATGLLILGWMLALLLTVVWLLSVGMQGWAAQHSGTDRSAQIDRDTARALFTLAGLLAGGPALIAMVAYAGRLRRTGAVFAVLTVAGAVLALLVVNEAYRSVRPPPTPPGAPAVCQEHSGGDTRCPGG